MPVGIDEFQSRDGGLYQSGRSPEPASRLPLSQVDPFMRTITKLREQGVLPQSFYDTPVAQSIQGGRILNAYGGVYEPGQWTQDPDLIRQAQEITSPQFQPDPSGEIAKFTAAKDTESSGWFALLEYFQVLNYAIAGGFNATINLFQGEEEEINPIVEAWRGLTLQDKETFSDVFRNVGWDSEDSFSYYTRGTLGFLLDVVLDPSTYVSFGSTTGQKLMTAGVTKSSAFRRGLVQFGNGTKMSPQKMVESIANKISDDVTKKIADGADVSLSSNLQTALSAKRLQGLSGSANEAVQSIAELGYSGDLAREALEKTFRMNVRKDVDQMIAFMFHGRSVRELEGLWKKADGDLDLFFAQTFDGNFGKRVAEELLSLEGLDLTWDNMLRLLHPDPAKSLKYKYLDEGGIKFSIPFTTIEKTLMPSYKLDHFWYKTKEIALDQWYQLAENTGVMFSPSLEGWRGAIGRAAQKVSGGASEAGRGAIKAIRTVGKMFGYDRRRAKELERLVIQHDRALHESIHRNVDLVDKMLRIEDPKGPIYEKVMKGNKLVTARFSRIDQDMNDLIYDTIMAEQDAQLAWVESGKGFMRDYQPQHLPNLEQKLRAFRGEGGKTFSDAEIEHAKGLVEQIQDVFNRNYDNMKAEGLEVVYLQNYLPIQYAHLDKTKRLYFREKASADVVDVFTRARELREEDRKRIGLEPIKNLQQLIFGRLFSAERASAERSLILDVTRKFGIHAEQVKDVLATIHAPSSEFSQQIVQAIRQRNPLGAFIGTELRKSIPAIDNLFTAIERAEFDEAVTMLENQETRDMVAGFLNIELPKESKATNLIQDIQATIDNGAELITQSSQAVTSVVSESIANTRLEFADKIAEIADGQVPLETVRALADTLEKKVLERLGLEGKRVMLKDIAAGPGKKVLESTENMDVIRLSFLDELLSDVESVASDVRFKELFEYTDKIADEIADAVESWSSRSKAGLMSSKFLEYDFEIAQMASRFYWVEVFETAVQANGRYSMAEPFMAKTMAKQIKEVLAIKDVKEAAAKSATFLKQYGHNPLVDATYKQFRMANGIPNDLPWYEFSMEQRAAFFEDLLPKVVELRKQEGLSVLNKPIFKSANKELNEAMKMAAGQTKKYFGKLAGKNKVFFGELMELMRTAGPQRAGLQYEPMRAINNAMVRSYTNRAYRVRDAINKSLKENEPWEVANRIRDAKLKSEGLVRDAQFAPAHLTEVAEEAVRAQTSVLKIAAVRAAEKAGIPASDIVGTFDEFQNQLFQLSEVVGRQRVGATLSRVNHTDYLEQVAEAVEALKGDVAKIFRGLEPGEVIMAQLDQHIDRLAQAHVRGNKMIDGIEKMSEQYTRLVSNPRTALGDIDVKTMNELLEQADGFQSQINDLLDRVSRAAEELFESIPNAGAVGKLGVTQFFRDDSTLGSFVNIIEAWYRDVDRMPKQLETALRKRRIESVQAARNAAEDAIEELQKKANSIYTKLAGPLNELRMIESLIDQAIDPHIATVNSMLSTMLGQSVDIASKSFDFAAVKDSLVRTANWRSLTDSGQLVDSFIAVHAAEIFVNNKLFTQDGWEQAVTQLLEDGPLNDKGYGVWAQYFSENRSQGLLDAAERVKLTLAQTTPITAVPDRVGLQAARTTPELVAAAPSLQEVQQGTWERVTNYISSQLDEDDPLVEGFSGFVARVDARVEDILRQRQVTSGWVNTLSSRAFLTPQKTAQMVEQMQREAALIKAIQEELGKFGFAKSQEHLQIVDSLVRRVKRRKIPVEALGFETPEEAVAALMRGWNGEEAFEQYLTRFDVPPAVFEQMFDEKLLDQINLAGPAQVNQYAELKRNIGEAFDKAYTDVFNAIDDPELLEDLRSKGLGDMIAALFTGPQRAELFERTEQEFMQMASSLLDDLIPMTKGGEISAEARALEKAFDDIMGVMAEGADPDKYDAAMRVLREAISKVPDELFEKRTQFWLWQFGFFRKSAARAPKTAKATASVIGDEARRQGVEFLDPKARAGILDSLVDAAQSQRVMGAAQRSAAEAQSQFKVQFQENADLVGASALARAELERHDLLDVVNDSRALDMAFDLEHEDVFRSTEHFRRYLQYQQLKHEASILSKALMAMPGREERTYLALRTLLNNQDKLDDLDVQRLMGVAGVLPQEIQAKAVAAGVIDYESVKRPLHELMSSENRAVLANHLDLDPGQFTGPREFLAALDELGVDGISVRQVKDVNDEVVNVYELTDARLSLPEEMGTSPVNLDPAIREAHQYLEMMADPPGSIFNLPSSEFQVRAVNRLVKRYVAQSGGQEAMESGFLYALTGKTRADRLTFGEAAFVIENVEQKLLSNVSPSGATRIPAQGPREGALFEAMATKNLIREEQLTDPGAARALLDRDPMIEGYDDMIPVSPAISAAMGELVDDFGRPITDLRMPRFVVDVLADDALRDTVFSNQHFRWMLKTFFDKPSNWFKTAVTLYFPSFHVRNMLDAVTRTFFAIGVKALSPTRNMKMWQLMSGSEGEMVINGVKYRHELLRHWINKAGLQVDFSAKIGEVRVGLPDTADVLSDAFRVGSSNYVFRKLADGNEVLRNFAGKGDNVMRASIFLEGLERGMSPGGAAQWTQKFMFDYAYGLTPFERDVMRRLFPFYTFMRFNIPLATELMLKQPRIITTLGKAETMMGTDDRELEKMLPSYIRDAWNFRIVREGSTIKTYQGRDMLALEDLGFITSPLFWKEQSATGVMFEILSRMNPILKVPVELAVGRNFYYDKAIEEEETVDYVLAVPGLKTWLEARDVIVGDKQYVRVNGDRWHMLNQLHLGRIYRTISDMFDGTSGEGVWRFSPFLTGIRQTSVDLRRRHEHLIMAANFRQGDITRALQEGDWRTAERLATELERGDSDQQAVEGAIRQLNEWSRNGVLDGLAQ